MITTKLVINHIQNQPTAKPLHNRLKIQWTDGKVTMKTRTWETSIQPSHLSSIILKSTHIHTHIHLCNVTHKFILRYRNKEYTTFDSLYAIRLPLKFIFVDLHIYYQSNKLTIGYGLGIYVFSLQQFLYYNFQQLIRKI